MWAEGPDIAGNFPLLLKTVVANRSNNHCLICSTFSLVGGNGGVLGYSDWILLAGVFGVLCWESVSTALHVIELIARVCGTAIGLGKNGCNIPTSMQAALLKYITCIFLHMYSACFVVLSPIVNLMGSQP